MLRRQLKPHAQKQKRGGGGAWRGWMRLKFGSRTCDGDAVRNARLEYRAAKLANAVEFRKAAALGASMTRAFRLGARGRPLSSRKLLTQAATQGLGEMLLASSEERKEVQAYNLVRQLKARGAPLHVGVLAARRAHFMGGQRARDAAREVEKGLRAYRDSAGIDVKASLTQETPWLARVLGDPVPSENCPIFYGADLEVNDLQN